MQTTGTWKFSSPGWIKTNHPRVRELTRPRGVSPNHRPDTHTSLFLLPLHRSLKKEQTPSSTYDLQRASQSLQQTLNSKEQTSPPGHEPGLDPWGSRLWGLCHWAVAQTTLLVTP